MTAKDAISPYFANTEMPRTGLPLAGISPDVPLVDVLPRLLETPAGQLLVTDGHTDLGIIDTRSLLEALGRMIAPRDDCSVITVECRASDYSASLIARAIEDADAHLVDLWSAPALHDSDSADRVRVTLRARLENPEAAVRSLTRYGFDVIGAYPRYAHDVTAGDDRLSALQVYLNV